jgi:uncharacterized protein (DUF2336 family)
MAKEEVSQRSMLPAAIREDLLDRLDALACEPARVSGEAVLDILVDLFTAAGEDMSPAARDACLDLTTLVMGQVASEARGRALERLAESPATPPSRLLAWAAGPIEVAAPVLRRAKSLSGTHLLRLLVEASPEHLRATAEREGLPEDVTDLLVLRGDREAIGRMLRNRSAAISRASFNKLAGEALSEPELRAAIVHRSDLPDLIVERLWPSVDAVLKARLVASGWRYSMSEIDEVGREISAVLVDKVRSGSLPQSIDTYATLVRDGRVALDEALSEVLETGRLVEAAQLIARVLSMPEGVALNLLYGVYDQGVAVLARRAPLGEAIVQRIVEARAGLAWVRSTDPRRAFAAPAEMEAAEATEVLAELVKLWEGGVANTGARRRFKTSG